MIHLAVDLERINIGCIIYNIAYKVFFLRPHIFISLNTATVFSDDWFDWARPD